MKSLKEIIDNFKSKNKKPTISDMMEDQIQDIIAHSEEARINGEMPLDNPRD